MMPTFAQRQPSSSTCIYRVCAQNRFHATRRHPHGELYGETTPRCARITTSPLPSTRCASSVTFVRCILSLTIHLYSNSSVFPLTPGTRIEPNHHADNAVVHLGNHRSDSYGLLFVTISPCIHTFPMSWLLVRLSLKLCTPKPAMADTSAHLPSDFLILQTRG